MDLLAGYLPPSMCQAGFIQGVLRQKKRGIIRNGRPIVALCVEMGQKQRRATAETLTSIPDGVPRVILATGSYIGEGFDDPRLDTLFLTMPISWRGTLQQYVGRLHRIHDGKKVVRVYDYVDSAVPMLARMFERRLNGYRAIGYELERAATVNADMFGEDAGF